MQSLQLDELTIGVDQNVPGCLRLDWHGYSSLPNPAERMAPFFAQVLAEAREGRCVVAMHFEALRQFNSATIATLIQFIYAAGRAKVPLHIHYDASLRWQALSFEAIDRGIHSFAPGKGPDVQFFFAHS